MCPGRFMPARPLLPELWINHADTPFAWFLVAQELPVNASRAISSSSPPLPNPWSLATFSWLSRFSPRVISQVCVQLRLSWENERRLSLVRSFAWQLADACYRTELLNLFLRLFNAITPAFGGRTPRRRSLLVTGTCNETNRNFGVWCWLSSMKIYFRETFETWTTETTD